MGVQFLDIMYMVHNKNFYETELNDRKNKNKFLITYFQIKKCQFVSHDWSRINKKIF